MLRTLHTTIWKRDHEAIFAQKCIVIGNISLDVMAFYGPKQI
jgi:hypothetical protein